MSGKVQIIRPEAASPSATLADVANRDGLDGVVVIARVNGSWSTAWSADVALASLCMASMKLQSDLIDAMHDQDVRPNVPDGLA